MRCQNGVGWYHGLEIQGRTRLQGIRIGLQDLMGSANQIRMGLQDLTDKEQQIEHAYEVSGRGCRISVVGNIRSNMPTMYQVRAAGSHRLGTTISRDRNKRSYMPTKYPDGAARSHGFDKADRTCLHGIRTGLQDLTGLEQQIQHAYAV